MAKNSAAYSSLKSGLKAVDNVLSFVKPTGGRPSEQERALFTASVALSYAVWESYIEDLAVEAVAFLAQRIDPGDVPEPVRKFITEGASPWQLSVHPGWQGVWVERVTKLAKGDEAQDAGFGLNTANKANVTKLYSRAALDPFRGLTAIKTDELEDLVKLRGAIVHTGQPPEDFYKQNAMAGRTLVEDLAKHTDAVIRQQVQDLAGAAPW